MNVKKANKIIKTLSRKYKLPKFNLLLEEVISENKLNITFNFLDGFGESVHEVFGFYSMYELEFRCDIEDIIFRILRNKQDHVMYMMSRQIIRNYKTLDKFQKTIELYKENEK